MDMVSEDAVLVFPRQTEPTLEKVPVAGDAEHRRAARLYRSTRLFTRVFVPVDVALVIVGIIGFLAGSEVFLVLLLAAVLLFVTGVVLARQAVKSFAVADARAGIPVPEASHLDVSRAVIQFAVTRQSLARALTTPDRSDESDQKLRALAPKIQMLEARHFTTLQAIRAAWLAGDDATWRARTDLVIQLGNEVKELRKSAFPQAPTEP